MSKLAVWGFLLVFAYILIVWGWPAFSLIVFVVVGCCYYYRKHGCWPWISIMSAITASGSGNGTPSGGISESRPKITFADVAGIDEAKEELLEIVDFLKHKDRYFAVGARIPRGAIMIGPSGVGKTLSAKAIAGEANVAFIEIAGSSFVNRYVGVGADNIRALFQRAKAKSPCIIFIDEFDSLGKRGDENSGSDHEYNQTINQLLVEMDGFSTDKNVMVLAATNRIDKIDEAPLRSGRFDRKIYFSHPDVKGREAILKVHSRNKPLSKNVNLRNIAELTPGLTGADLENILNESAIMAGKVGKKEIEESDIHAAREKLILGKEKRSMIIGIEEKRVIAYHESGHALLAALLPHCDNPDKVTVMPRDLALGLTTLSIKERHNVSKDFLNDQIIMLLGGRAAEKIACNTETAGAKSDIDRATATATAMVCEYGMSEELGPVAINMSKASNGNSTLQARAHDEVMRLMKWSYDKAQSLLRDNIMALHASASLLLDKETVSGEEIVELLIRKP